MAGGGWTEPDSEHAPWASTSTCPRCGAEYEHPDVEGSDEARRALTANDMAAFRAATWASVEADRRAVEAEMARHLAESCSGPAGLDDDDEDACRICGQDAPYSAHFDPETGGYACVVTAAGEPPA